MIALAASLFDVSGIAHNAAGVAEALFFVVAALVATLVVYGLAKGRRFR